MLQHELNLYRQCTARNKTFRNELKHCASFVGKDFKQLMQVLPLVLRKIFQVANRNEPLRLLIDTFISLGKLTSLVYVRRVKTDFGLYLQEIRSAIDHLQQVMFHLDNSMITARFIPSRKRS